MKSYTKIFVPVFLAIVIGSLTFAFAQTGKVDGKPQPNGENHKGFRPPPDGMRGGLPPQVLEKLNLTDEQKTQIKAIHDANRTADKTYFDQLKSADEKLRAMIDGGTFDEATARQILTAKSQAQIELELSRLKTDAAIKNILTADQKATLETLKKQGPPEGRRGGGEGFGRDMAPPPPPQDN